MADPVSTSFSLGVNYPWRNYGQDFGSAATVHSGVSRPETLEEVSRDFAGIRECGASVVRWFLFADGRGGFVSKNGIPLEPDGSLFTDVGAALALAERHGLKLCFSLIDYLWLQDHSGTRHGHGHEHVLHFAAGREAFLLRVLIPLFREFRGHPGLYAWEIANEPEWAIREFNREPAAKVHLADFRAYAQEIAEAVHESANVPVTLGSARLMWIRAWSELPLDFYQAHYYPTTEQEPAGGLRQQLTAASNLDKPLWLGELPARDPSDSAYSLGSALDLCRSAGLCGAAVWRWTTPEQQGADRVLGPIDPAALTAWTKRGRAEAQSA